MPTPENEETMDRRKPAEVRLTQDTIDYMTLLVQQSDSTTRGCGT